MSWGAKRGEARKDLAMELAIDLIFASLFYRLLITEDAIDSGFVEKFISHVLMSLGIFSDSAPTEADS